MKETKDVQNIPEESSDDLRGTLTFVILLGIFIIASWVAIYYVFITR